MKRAFEVVYNGILAKGASPFIYLRFVVLDCSSIYLIIPSCSLEIDPRSVDVNVHPTKREVHFLNEDVIIEKISDALQRALAVQSHSRAFEYQVRSCEAIVVTSRSLKTFSVRLC
jgi:DNA mismatch repair protein MLH1